MWFRMVSDRPAVERTNSFGSFFDDLVAYEQFKQWQETERKKMEEEKKKKEDKKKEYNLPRVFTVMDMMALLTVLSIPVGMAGSYVMIMVIKNYVEAMAGLLK